MGRHGRVVPPRLIDKIRLNRGWRGGRPRKIRGSDLAINIQTTPLLIHSHNLLSENRK